MASNIPDVMAQIDQYRTNPARIQQVMVQQVIDTSNGDIDLVDPTNPVVMTMESGAVMAAAAMTRYEVVLRRQYATQAQVYDDLYYHMSDKDYLDRFAQPSGAAFSLMFRKDEVLNKMVVDPTTGYKKIVIPRNSYFTVNNTVFGIEYPIEIRQLAHGGLQIVYDTDKPSPIEELRTNLITWDERTDADNNVYLWLEFDTLQFSIKSQLGDLSASTKFSQNIALTDQYYFTRVYLMSDNNGWQEIPTTHSAQIYDIEVTTAVLVVTDGNVNVSIPEIYTTDATNSRKIRVDVYQTQGPITTIMGNFAPSSFQAVWRAIDEAERDVFMAPLQTLQTQIVYSNAVASGGRVELSFEDLRARVINNSIGMPNVPISTAQIENSLIDSGYQIVKNIDVITNRNYLATRDLPQPSAASLITPAAASIQTALLKMQDAVSLASVIDNGTSITITPDTIYQNTNGVVSLVPTATIQAILNLPIENRAIAVNDAGYYYSPFHYVLDASGLEFAVRPYYLDGPVVDSMVFVGANDTTLLQVSIDSYAITKTSTGYQLVISTASSDQFKALDDSEVYVQIAFTPIGETAQAYQNGVFLGLTAAGERQYSFDLSTNFNVTSVDGLELEKFFMFTTDPRLTPSLLFQTFDIFFATSRTMDVQYKADAVDAALGKFLLPVQIAGITHEQLRVRFGYHLERLWARARSVVSTAQYQKYTTDIPMLYTDNVFQKNPIDGSTIIWVDGAPTTVLLHAKGTPVLDSDDNPVYQFRAGDTILDANGQPIVVNGRGMFRQIDFMLLEGVYWFATDSVAVNYRNELTAILVDWITNGLEDIQARLLEQTQVYFYPKTTTGPVEIMVADGVLTTMEAGQSFVATLYVSKVVDQNQALKDQLKVKLVQVINAGLANPTISMSGITKAAVDAFSTDVKDAELSGLGSTNNYAIVTLINETDRPSIRKRLVAQPDGFLIIDEAVTVDYVRHELPDA